MAKDIQSPCVDICQLKSDICVGCGRVTDEIRRWHGMKRKEKMLVVQRARERLKKVNRSRT
ncbi:DUF1289 domain-containing protein [Thioalkalivibrio thiocyanodenitrificans]|uniref:DUF1289 domain-containing protein n=1 Tax=Thioalkalivibrio thiocyanodenitrificans TaxID=243063 RepID=UPI00037BACFE|nr:DUF1289 domain-containing protein [Thioalkalivibrio thiocyanodenitrificans]